MSITANTISNNTTYTSCDLGCISSINNIVSFINVYSTGTTSQYGYVNIFEASTGKYFSNPVSDVRYLASSIGSITNVDYLISFNPSDWTSNTYPFTGITPNIISAYSGTVCDYSSYGVRTQTLNSYTNTHYKNYFKINLINPLDVRDFEILASPITNFSYSGAPGVASYELAYQYSGGSVIYTNPTYII